MRLIIEARLEGNDIEPTVVPIPLAVIDRYDDDLEQLGLSLAEGRELLAAAQSVVVSSQASRWIATLATPGPSFRLIPSPVAIR